MRANCCICSDIFDEVNPISATPCGHVYHTSCLMVWIGNNNTCPICRKSVKPEKIQNLFLNVNTTCAVNSTILENTVADLNARLIAKEAELRECKKDKEAIRLFVKIAEEKSSNLQQKVYALETDVQEMQLKLGKYYVLDSQVKKLEKINTVLSNDLQLMNNVQTIVHGSKEDTEKILQEVGNAAGSTKQMATYCSVLKRELEKVIYSKNKLLELNSKLKLENSRYVTKLKTYENIRKQLDDRNCKNESVSETDCGKNSKVLDSDTPQPGSSGLLQKSTPESCKISNSVVDTSPLTAPFGSLKFHLRIGPGSSKSIKNDKLVGTRKGYSNFHGARDENSVITTGYNGFGGHCNFINSSSSSTRSLKRKL